VTFLFVSSVRLPLRCCGAFGFPLQCYRSLPAYDPAFYVHVKGRKPCYNRLHASLRFPDSLAISPTIVRNYTAQQNRQNILFSHLTCLCVHPSEHSPSILICGLAVLFGSSEGFILEIFEGHGTRICLYEMPVLSEMVQPRIEMHIWPELRGRRTMAHH